ncbi:MAG: peroxiredoxin family protein, partial [Polyangiaceae bacterium]
YERTGLCTVIYFFPKAFTPGCTKEAKMFASNYPELQMARAEVVGISSDALDKQCAFAKSTGATFPMIGDSTGAICKSYGVLFPLVKIARRVTFVVDNADHKIVGRTEHLLDIGRHRDHVLGIVDELARARRLE